MTIPSYQVKTTDAIEVREGSRTRALFANANETLKEYRSPAWVVFDPGTFTGTLKELPVFADQDTAVDMQAVFEYYTR